MIAIPRKLQILRNPEDLQVQNQVKILRQIADTDKPSGDHFMCRPRRGVCSN